MELFDILDIVQPIVDAVNSVPSSILNQLQSILVGTFNFILTGVFNAVSPVLEDQTQVLLTYPIPVDTLLGLWTLIVEIIALGCLVAFPALGIYIMLSSSSPYKRERAKTIFQDILIMSVLISISYFIYLLLVDLSSAITTAVWVLSGPEKILYRTDNPFEIYFLGVFYMIGLLLFNMTLSFRVIIVMAGVAFFPIGLALLYFPLFKSWGLAIINALLLMIFLSVVDVILILVATTIFKTIGGVLGNIMAISAYYLITIINIMILFSVFSSVAVGIDKVIVVPIKETILKPVKEVEKVIEKVS